MFNEIENTMTEVLRKNLKAVPKENIGVRKPDFKEKKSLPAICIENLDFEADEVGVGRSVDTADKQREEFFSGDGKERSFKLSEKPLRPVLSAEHPVGTRLRRDVDYTVDYKEGVINLHSPPAKGERNVAVRYLMPLETKGVRFKLRYHVNVWSEDEAERNQIAVQVVKALLREEETFNRKGLVIKPLRGFNAPQNEATENFSGKTLEYLLEAYLQVEVPLPRIEGVKIAEK